MPAAGGQAAEQAGAGRRVIQVEGLRVVLLGEVDDFGGLHQVGGGDEDGAYGEVFIVEEGVVGHWGC